MSEPTDLQMTRAVRNYIAAASPQEAGEAFAVATGLTPAGVAAAICYREGLKLSRAADEPGADPRLQLAADILHDACRGLQDIADAQVRELEAAQISRS